jgi:hypothetical protein
MLPRVTMTYSIRMTVAGMLLVIASAAKPGGAHAFSAADKARVLYVGDSIAYETGAVLAYILHAGGKASFRGATKGGMAICDWFPETRAPGGPGTFLDFETPPIPDLRQLVLDQRPHAIVMQFWGNSWDFTPCMRGDGGAGAPLTPGTPEYFDRYRDDAIRAMAIIQSAATAAGIAMPKVFWVLQGPDRGSPERPRILNTNYLALAQRWPDAFRAIDAGREVSMAAFYYDPGDRYDFAQFLPCYQYERDNGTCIDAFGGVAQIHRDSDDIHFCLGNTVKNSDWFGNCDVPSPGLTRYGLSVVGAVIRELGL